ncbi:MAG: ATP-binding protein [Clostridiales bacterium]|nr:ATP-binding protein [Clostridiales bacterium]
MRIRILALEAFSIFVAMVEGIDFLLIGELMIRKVPYGLSDFSTIATENYAFIDKTHFIAKLEDATDFATFLRPRKFGKTMLLSMLNYYYDYKYENKFNSIFGDTWIGSNPTPLRNTFAVLKFDFSGINLNSPLLPQFSAIVYATLAEFVESNSIKLIHPLDCSSIPSQLTNDFFSFICGFNKRIYLLIDEYDNYANALLAANMDAFKSIMGSGGFVRAFYEVLKKATSNGIIRKILLSGVTPIALDSLTSGFNITEDLSQDEMFNDMAGFTRNEVESLIDGALPWLASQKGDVADLMAILYDGYKFCTESSQHIFNSGMTLYFLKKYLQQRRAPKTLLDKNIISDYSKIKALASIGLGETEEGGIDELEDAKNHRYDIIKAIAVGEPQPADLTMVYELKKFDSNDFLSLLFYTGYLTFGSEDSEEALVIPNAVFKDIYMNYFSEIALEPAARLQHEEASRALAMLANEGDTKLFVQCISHILSSMDFRAFIDFDEASLARVAHQLALGYSGYKSIIEKHVGMGYVDQALMPGKVPVKYYALIEYKYVKVRKLTLNNIKAAWEDALLKLRKYASDKEFERLDKQGSLKKWIVIFTSSRCIVNQEIDLDKPNASLELQPDTSLPKIIEEMNRMI